MDIIHQEITQGKDLLTLDPSKGVDAVKAAKTGAIAAAATATGQVLAGGVLAGTGALGIGGTAVGATGTSTGSGLIAATVGGAGAAATGGALAGLAEGKSLEAAVDQGSIAALPGAIGGAARVLAGAGAQGLASGAGASPAAARAMTAFAGGFAGDQAVQQTMVATGLQERTNLAQSVASGAIAYVVTEGIASTSKLEPAIRQPPSGVSTAPRPGSQALVRRDFETLAPNRGFAAGFTTKETLAPGTVIDRFGGRGGRFVSPGGTPFSARGLPPENARLPYQRLEVLKPLEVDAGIAGYAFGGGGGIQYELPASVQKLIDAGVLRVMK